MNIPEFCPSCNQKLEWTDTKTDLICTNVFCPAQVLYHISHYCKVMGIEEISATTLEKFNLTQIQDLYNLTYEDIIQLEGFAEKSTKIILSQIKNSLKEVLPAKLIEAFGVRNLGSKNAEQFCRKFPKNSVEQFLTLDYENFAIIDGFGPKIIENILNSRQKCKELYKFLLKKGLEIKQTENISEKLVNQKIVMTGSYSIPRHELQKILELHGAEVQSSVTKKTTILIAENINGNSSKLKKARENGTKIVSYEEFFGDLI